jgi:hypothetical protein
VPQIEQANAKFLHFRLSLGTALQNSTVCRGPSLHVSNFTAPWYPGHFAARAFNVFFVHGLRPSTLVQLRFDCTKPVCAATHTHGVNLILSISFSTRKISAL